MDKRYEELLQCVQRPGRYIGGEVNAIVKDWNSVDLKVALVFPDIYDIGMSHLGIKILYHILNSQPNMLCERAFAPWVDMERLLRDKKLPIVTLENNKPLGEFDIIGFSLLHELTDFLAVIPETNYFCLILFIHINKEFNYSIFKDIYVNNKGIYENHK